MTCLQQGHISIYNQSSSALPCMFYQLCSILPFPPSANRLWGWGSGLHCSTLFCRCFNKRHFLGTIPCGGHHTAPLGIAFSLKRGYTKGDLCGWGKPLNDHPELLRGWLWPKTRFSMNTNRDTGSSSPKPAGRGTRLLSTYLLSCRHKSETPLHIRAISSSPLAEEQKCSVYMELLHSWQEKQQAVSPCPEANLVL